MIWGQIMLKGLMLDMSPAGAALFIMVLMSHSFNAFSALFKCLIVVSMLSLFLMNKDQKDVYNEFSIPTIYYFPTELQVYHYSILIIIYCTCLRVSGFH